MKKLISDTYILLNADGKCDFESSYIRFIFKVGEDKKEYYYQLGYINSKELIWKKKKLIDNNHALFYVLNKDNALYLFDFNKHLQIGLSRLSNDDGVFCLYCGVMLSIKIDNGFLTWHQVSFEEQKKNKPYFSDLLKSFKIPDENINEVREAYLDYHEAQRKISESILPIKAQGFDFYSVKESITHIPFGFNYSALLIIDRMLQNFFEELCDNAPTVQLRKAALHRVLSGREIPRPPQTSDAEALQLIALENISFLLRHEFYASSLHTNYAKQIDFKKITVGVVRRYFYDFICAALELLGEKKSALPEYTKLSADSLLINDKKNASADEFPDLTKEQHALCRQAFFYYSPIFNAQVMGSLTFNHFHKKIESTSNENALIEFSFRALFDEQNSDSDAVVVDYLCADLHIDLSLPVNLGALFFMHCLIHKTEETISALNAALINQTSRTTYLRDVLEKSIKLCFQASSIPWFVLLYHGISMLPLLYRDRFIETINENLSKKEQLLSDGDQNAFIRTLLPFLFLWKVSSTINQEDEFIYTETMIELLSDIKKINLVLSQVCKNEDAETAYVLFAAIIGLLPDLKQKEILQMLLKAKDIDLFKWSFKNGNIIFVQSLLKAIEKLSLSEQQKIQYALLADGNAYTLCWACENGHFTIVQMLLDVALKLPMPQYKIRRHSLFNRNDACIFRTACENGHTAIVELLLNTVLKIPDLPRSNMISILKNLFFTIKKLPAYKKQEMLLAILEMENGYFFTLACKNELTSIAQILLEVILQLPKLQQAEKLRTILEKKEVSVTLLLLGLLEKMPEQQKEDLLTAIVNGNSTYAINWACENGKTAIVQQVLKIALELPESQNQERLITMLTNQKAHPFRWAYKNGHDNIFAILFEALVNLEKHQTQAGATLASIVEILSEYFVEKWSFSGHEKIKHFMAILQPHLISTFIFACKHSKTEMMNTVFSVIVRIQAFTEQNILLTLLEHENAFIFGLVCKNGQAEIAKKLLQTIKKFSPSRCKEMLLTFLNTDDFYALTEKDVLLTLLEHENGFIFRWACKNGQAKIVEKLLKTITKLPPSQCAAFLTADDAYDFCFACKNGHKDIVLMLLDAMKSLPSPEKEETLKMVLTAVDACAFRQVCENGHDEILQILLDAIATIPLPRNQEILSIVLTALNGYALKQACINKKESVVLKLCIAIQPLPEKIKTHILENCKWWSPIFFRQPTNKETSDLLIKLREALDKKIGKNYLQENEFTYSDVFLSRP